MFSLRRIDAWNVGVKGQIGSKFSRKRQLFLRWGKVMPLEIIAFLGGIPITGVLDTSSFRLKEKLRGLTCILKKF